VGVLSTANFQGLATFFNAIIFAAPHWDFDINGGQVNMEVVHMDNAKMDSRVNGGAFRLVNNSSRNTGGNNLPYTVTFGAAAGLPGVTNEFIGCYNYCGSGWANTSPGNSVNVWGNYGLSAYPPVVSGLTATPGSGQVTVRWTNASGSMAYRVKRSASAAGPFAPLATTSAANYTDTNVISNAAYYYVVSVLNAFGEGADCAPVGTRDVLLPRSGWVCTASAGGSPANAIDGNLATRWSTDALQTNGQWFQVDMRSPTPVFAITLDTTPSPNDYPRGYEVYLSNDASNWGPPVATGTAYSAVTLLTVPLQNARYVRIVQTGSATGNYWTIHELNIYGRPPDPPGSLTSVSHTNRVVLNWAASPAATRYKVKRSTSDGGPYATIADLATNSCTDSGVTAGTAYYYVVSAMNSVGESGDSAQVSARPVSLSPPQLSYETVAHQIQLSWPQDHSGWFLQIQTNGVGFGLGTNWFTLPGSDLTNQVTIPVDPSKGSVFLRLTCPLSGVEAEPPAQRPAPAESGQGNQ